MSRLEWLEQRAKAIQVKEVMAHRANPLYPILMPRSMMSENDLLDHLIGSETGLVHLSLNQQGGN